VEQLRHGAVLDVHAASPTCPLRHRDHDLSPAQPGFEFGDGVMMERSPKPGRASDSPVGTDGATGAPPASPASLSISVVSNGHGALIRRLLETLDANRPAVAIEVILTLNIPEPSPIQGVQLSFPVRTLLNARPAGFAENHNVAFRHASGEFFCVINPDIVFQREIFTDLIGQLADPRIGVVAPRLVDAEGRTQDSYRRLPTPFRLLSRYTGRDRCSDLVPVGSDGRAQPDWIAGMFLLMRSRVFHDLGGFDQRYFLYFEDVDLGVRARLAGYRLVVDTRLCAVHEARRDSHRKLAFLAMHLKSAGRFFLSRSYRSARRLRGRLHRERLPGERTAEVTA
jgi:N-acetylglucosaminyl-diphospho-decaprenol L-rhamnosyltransferase